jgi:hypothetical protein
VIRRGVRVRQTVSPIMQLKLSQLSENKADDVISLFKSTIKILLVILCFYESTVV